MNFIVSKKAVLFSVFLLALMLATETVLTAPPAAPRPPLPNPVLFFMGQEPAAAEGKQLIRYTFSVDNFSAYPDELFAASPELPPCGKNTKAARTWVDI